MTPLEAAAAFAAGAAVDLGITLVGYGSGARRTRI